MNAITVNGLPNAREEAYDEYVKAPVCHRALAKGNGIWKPRRLSLTWVSAAIFAGVQTEKLIIISREGNAETHSCMARMYGLYLTI